MNFDIKSARRRLQMIWGERDYSASLYKESSLERMSDIDNSFDCYLPIWVQLRSGHLYCATSDMIDGEYAAVIGQDFYKKISTYFTDWVAWSFVPTQEQMDSIRWPKATHAETHYTSGTEQQYMFGGNTHD